MKFRACKPFFIFLLIFGVPWLGHSQSTIEITDENQHSAIGLHMEILIDENAMFSISDIMDPTIQNSFKSSTQKILNIGVTDAALWCKFKVVNHTGEDTYFEVANMALDSISLYRIENGQPLIVAQGGNHTNFNDLEVRFNTNLFNLGGKSEEVQEFYLRIRHTRGTQTPVYVGTMKGFAEQHHKFDFIQGIYFGLMLLMIFYNLFIYFSVRDNSYIYYVIYGACITMLNAYLTGYVSEYLWPNFAVLNKYQDIFGSTLAISGILFTMSFLNTKENAPTMHKVFKGFMYFFIGTIFIVLFQFFMLGTIVIEVASLLLIICFFITAFRIYKKGFEAAKFFLLAWSILLLGVVVFVLKDFNLLPYNTLTVYSLQIGSALEALLLSFALADKINLYKKEKEVAQELMVHSLKENEKLILSQNQILEVKVMERTNELNQSLQNLKDTQAQLIQSEKMASLGELTAGIAHEIQNPLNFVNNFSEVSAELAEELKTEIDNGNVEDSKLLANDLIQNLKKINTHGKRASNIVKGMLEHSRSDGDEKQWVDINNLVDENMRLSYHGLRAKDKTFNSDFKIIVDSELPKAFVISQDIGRVLINMYNNAFYSVSAKNKIAKEEGMAGYKPFVSVTTSSINGMIEIVVEDNGQGIPQEVINKIFQPFFTTKPTGQGTGLGLSMSYDIIKNRHGGEIRVRSVPGESTIFTISFPVNHNGKSNT